MKYRRREEIHSCGDLFKYFKYGNTVLSNSLLVCFPDSRLCKLCIIKTILALKSKTLVMKSFFGFPAYKLLKDSALVEI